MRAATRLVVVSPEARVWGRVSMGRASREQGSDFLSDASPLRGAGVDGFEVTAGEFDQCGIVALLKRGFDVEAANFDGDDIVVFAAEKALPGVER